ncbi:hypothetical protein DNH61_17565 [Paenibacillus sambharensis]|uniref:Uncharacterized protein n=1 Tax=Paenibacillus sambharensis TaxID=1803190 RepID=A0A2W1L5H6_9BACL|nr:hypothetical protein [Paenibacillus sambharensis]PZD94526.1 hypothetical protein DNH61_17565 [Paenibacillus sambharensis]
MPFTKIKGVPGYVLYMTNVYMDETCIYTMVSDTWQPDEDMTYQGAAWYSYPEAAWRTFIFPQDNVTHVSGTGTEGALYYTVEHPEEHTVTIHKLSCRTSETTEIISLKPDGIMGSGEGQNAYYTLRGINERYALMQLCCLARGRLSGCCWMQLAGNGLSYRRARFRLTLKIYSH